MQMRQMNARRAGAPRSSNIWTSSQTRFFSTLKKMSTHILLWQAKDLCNTTCNSLTPFPLISPSTQSCRRNWTPALNTPQVPQNNISCFTNTLPLERAHDLNKVSQEEFELTRHAERIFLYIKHDLYPATSSQVIWLIPNKNLVF
jgi:hypothetical protein